LGLNFGYLGWVVIDINYPSIAYLKNLILIKYFTFSYCRLYNKNKDGTLTLEEIKAGIGKLTDDKDVDVQELFKSIDTDGSGAINYTEFLASTMDQNTYLKEEKLYEAFRAFDKDGSGKISTDEVRSVMKGEDVKKIEEMCKGF
jgi:Ca2+-binding EF-hand superfamily protein